MYVKFSTLSSNLRHSTLETSHLSYMWCAHDSGLMILVWCWSWSLLHRESVRPQIWSQLILRWSNSWSNAGLHNQRECLVHHKTHNHRTRPYPHRSPMPPLASPILPVPASLLSSAFKRQHHLHVLKHQGKCIQNIADCAYIIYIYVEFCEHFDILTSTNLVDAIRKVDTSAYYSPESASITLFMVFSVAMVWLLT